MVDTWSETALVSITAQGGSDVQFATLTETVDIDIGDKDFDSINTLRGGRMVKFNPQEPTTITLEAYPVEAGTDSGTTGNGFFDLMNTADTSQPISISLDRTRNKYRVALLWTNKSTATSATEALASSSSQEGLRIVAADGYFTSVKPSFTDGVLKYTVMFKTPAFDKGGSANVKMESTDGTADLTAVAAYTSSAKW
jgi:hypothetical protein